MSTKTRRKHGRFWITVGLLNLIPVAAFGSAAPSKVEDKSPSVLQGILSFFGAGSRAPAASAPAPAAKASGAAKAPATKWVPVAKQLEAKNKELEEKNKRIEELEKGKTAKSEEPAAPVQKASGDLSLSDLAAFPGYGRAFDGRSVILGARIFDECLPFFQVHSTKTNSSIAVQDSKKGPGIGFLITDENGKGRSCMAAQKAAGRQCSDATPCTSLSRVDNATFDLLGQPDGARVGLIHRDPNRDLDPLVFEELNGADPIVYRSPEALAAEAAKKRAQDRADRIEELSGTAKNCRGSDSELRKAKTARNQLKRMGVDIEEIDKQLTLAELALMERKAMRASSLEDLEEIRDDLRLWAEDEGHEEYGDRVAVVLHKIAQKYVTRPGAKPSDYDLASATIAEAQSLAVSDRFATTLANYQTDIAYGKVKAVAGMGLQGNYLFWPYYSNLMQKLQANVMAANSLESRATAMGTLQGAAQLPAQAAQIDQQRAQMQQQIQQAMYQAMNPQMGQQQQFGQQGQVINNGAVMNNGMAMNGMAGTPYPNTMMPNTMMPNSTMMPGAVPPGTFPTNGFAGAGPSWVGGTFAGSPMPMI